MQETIYTILIMVITICWIFSKIQYTSVEKLSEANELLDDDETSETNELSEEDTS